jgi:hypothetical protein
MQTNSYVVAVVGIKKDIQYGVNKDGVKLLLSGPIIAQSKEEAIGILLPELLKELVVSGHMFSVANATCVSVLTLTDIPKIEDYCPKCGGSGNDPHCQFGAIGHCSKCGGTGKKTGSKDGMNAIKKNSPLWI